MRSLKEILQEMGFNEKAPYGAQKAFIQHLIAAAQQTNPSRNSSTAPVNPSAKSDNLVSEAAIKRPTNRTKSFANKGFAPSAKVKSSPQKQDDEHEVGTQLEFHIPEDKRVS